MKFNIEVELDWINEEVSIDEEIKRRIIDGVSVLIFKDLKKEMLEKMSKTISESLDLKINEMYEGFLGKKFDIRDQWGDIKKEGVCVLDILKEKFSKDMFAIVGEDGKETTYNGKPRYLHIIDSQSKRQIEEFLDRLSKEVINGIKKDINDEAVKRITNAILSDYTLKELIK